MMDVREQTGTAGRMPVALAHAASPARPGRLRLALRVCGFVVLAVLVLFAGGFGWFADKVSHMTTPTNPAKADAIIVLTGGQSRLDAAMDLLASGKGERLLISGVHPSATKRQLQAAMGGDKQLFSCCVDIDRAALDTIGNAEESAKWVENHAYGSIIIVTNNYHMPRSLLEMGRLLHGAHLEPYPVVNTNLGNGNWLTKPEALRVLLTEYSKYVLSLARGFLPLRTTPEGMTLAQASSVSKN
ncbi:YdcF family protein [Mesorhizobium sp. GbtcB19]|uniref:YdcF family protein n=1 Tax=Mesorhizobium sp. GbtcB19 TaxID=2824764 RepID=UPI001C3010D5|nr:YdcF family protein [Mesorhizobium sp. GbtcB19]